MKTRKPRTFKMSPFVESVAVRAKYFPKNIPAIIYGDEFINWADLYSKVCRLANALKDKANVQKDDKVAYIFHNTPQFLEINFAVQMLGAVPVPINYRYVGTEIEYTVNDCDAVALICEEDILDQVLKIKDQVPKVRLFSVDADSVPEGFIKYLDLVNYHKKKQIKVSVSDNDIGVIIYTGGTTGRSKGVMLSNRNILTNQEGVLRGLISALPKVNIKCIKYAESVGESKYLNAFDVYNSYFEGLFLEEGYEDSVLVLDVLGTDEIADLAATMVFREGKVKIMVGSPPPEEVNIRVISNMKEQFRSLANLLPYVYTKKGRRKATIMTLGKILRRKIKLKGKFGIKLKLVKSLMKKTKAAESDDRSQEFLSLLVAPPMFHLAGYAFFLMFSTYVGGTCMIPRKTSFSSEDLLKIVDKHKPKWILLVPTMYKEAIKYLEKNPDHGLDLSSVRMALSGAALLPAEDKKKIFKLFPNAIVVDAFGQTEMAAISSMKIDTDPSKVKQGSVGKLDPGIEAKIMGDDGIECKDGEIGEIYYRGKTVMRGYYGDNEKTSRTIDEDGWLHSGDLGYFKDEELFTVDRKGECINTGAEKVFPIEVEETIYEHSAVKNICIIGVPDEKWGSAVRAVVVLEKGKNLTEQQLIEWCVGKMAGYKKPKSVVFIEQMPISPVGKVLRGKIRQLYGQPKVND
jgi:acyl-CoA synthetase (AMP-forming)/AMP-acid ligase II